MVRECTHERREKAERAGRGGLRGQWNLRARGGTVYERVLSVVAVFRGVSGKLRREAAHHEDALQANEHESEAEHRVYLFRGD